MRHGALLFLALALVGASGCTRPPAGQPSTSAPALTAAQPLRVGYLATITHAQAVVGVANGRLASSAGVPLATQVFHTGTTAMSAMLSGELDILYAGPAPAVSGFLRSKGSALRIVAGSASGGTALVARPGLDLNQLQAARLATPGLANTQDLALRHFLRARGLSLREHGGSVSVLRLANPDILNLFRRGEIDAAWVPEPWATRLVTETGARVAIDERSLWPEGRFATTVVVVSARALQERRAAVLGFLSGHVAITRWLVAEQDQAMVSLGHALAVLQGKALPQAVLAEALGHVDFTTDPLPETVAEQARRAAALGLLGNLEPKVDGLFDLSLLEEVTR